MRFSGRTALITGAGNGIGREYALGFAAEGASAVVVDVDAVAVGETVARVEAGGGAALGVVADVTDEVGIKDAVEQAVDRFGGIDFLINNAGLHLGRWNEASTLSAAEWRHILDVNVVGAVVCATACRPYLKDSGHGVIVNQPSMAAYTPNGGAYTVSKLALNGVTMALAGEFAADNIRVVGIAPGMIGSPIILDHLEPHHKDLVIRGQMVKRFGEMGDVVGVVLFLCSHEASFITAQTLLVDGGFTPKP